MFAGRLPTAFLAAVLLATSSAAAQTYTKLHEFSAGRGLPYTALTEDSNGVLWGTTMFGGDGQGSVYTLTPNGLGGFTFAEPHSFTGGAQGAGPLSELVEGSDGKLYGIAQSTYAVSSLNHIYRIDANGSNFELVYSLDPATEGYASRAALIQGSDGLLYGTAPYGGAYGEGTAFSFDPSSGAFTVIHSFRKGGGWHPQGALLEGVDGRLYGTAEGGGSGWQRNSSPETYEGVVFRMDKSGANYVVLHSFTGADGSAPQSALIQLDDGFLYGTTFQSNDLRGVVFKLDTTGHNFQVLHHLTPAEGWFFLGSLVEGTDGRLYGMASGGSDGIAFRLSTTGTNFEIVHSFVRAEGSSPADGLLMSSDGFLYGSLPFGGASDYGTVFRLDPATTAVTVVHSFTARDTFWPRSPLTLGPGGWFYGVAGGGGSFGGGAVFRIDSAGTSYSILRSFGGSDGTAPVGPVIIGADGFLYGTTHGGFGFAGNYGTVWRMATDGSSFSVLHAFSGADGEGPFCGVIQGADGFLYGTTASGGTIDTGVVYRVGTSGLNFSVLHEFDATTNTPYAPLLQGADGKLYGTTYFGGTNNSGSIYRLDTSGGNFELIHSFNGADGYGAFGGVIQPADGKLYGVTFRGTPNEMGVVYKLDPSGSNFAVIHTFSGLEGKFSDAPLFAASDGFLYGTTEQGGAAGKGTVFRLDSAGGGFSTVHSFGGPDGSTARGGLIQGSDGALYGMAYDGGTLNGGVVFRLEPGTLQARSPRLLKPR